MPSHHSIRATCAAALVCASIVAWAQQPPPPPRLDEPNGSTFTIFVRGTPAGSEQVAVNRTAEGWNIVSSGRLAAPIDVIARRLQVRYTPEWRPIDFSFDGAVRGQSQVVHTVVEGTTAKSDVTIGGSLTQKADTIDPAALLVLPNSFFGPYEALAARLRTLGPGTTVPVFGVPQVTFSIRIGESSPEQIQTAARVVAARRTRITFLLPGAQLDGDLWVDETNRLIRLSLPAQGLEVVREDIAAVSSRTVTISRPNDERVTIPANGFTLAGTLSRPVTATAARLPAVVLVGGSGPQDRDEVTFGIPIMGQIAGALADSGFIVLRYDKRGIGQSGGRAEAASLADYADDVRAAVRFLTARKDVDPKRVAVIGHSEGGAVALMAAAKEKRIAAVGLLATPGTTGAEIMLAQQQHALDRSKLSAEEKQQKIDLQKRLHEAVLTGKGWDSLPPELRRQVDTPEFQSILAYDPAKIVPDVRQPILIVQGELDTQIDPVNADRLEALARKRKNAPGVEAVKVPGVNHLLVPATTGEVDEYGTLADKHVSARVVDAIAAWLNQTLKPY
jgi:pimeloyl-ACP methyl ester carboxylesterase